MKCLLCSYTDPDPLKIEVHINREHFDTTDTSTLKSNSPSYHFTCPFCSEKFKSANVLETHINAIHGNNSRPLKVLHHKYKFCYSQLRNAFINFLKIISTG